MAILVRTMTLADLDGGMRLKAAAGWNQTDRDWRRFLDADPRGTFVADVHGEIAGTVATIVYEDRVAWIGMMLVDPAWRRRGIGESLMRAALEYLSGRAIATIGLDATPMGQPLYERLGFVATARLNRWSLDRETRTDTNEAAIESADPRPVDVADLIARDSAAFGASRSGLIRSFVDEHPGRIITIGDEWGAGGAFLIARQGAVADHLGLWLADSADVAEHVLDTALGQTRRPVVIADVPADHPWAGTVLASRGFRVARDLTRMYLATPARHGVAPIGHAAILGPEFG